MAWQIRQYTAQLIKFAPIDFLHIAQWLEQCVGCGTPWVCEGEMEV